MRGRGISVSASDEDLIRVTIFALENEEFRQAWDAAVRETADKMTAAIVGRRMAGEDGGVVEVCWDDTPLPVPFSLGLERTRVVFTRAVTEEVKHRVEAMTSRGSFG